MSRSLDVGTLDALVLATDGPEDVHAWEALVREPGGVQAWRDAVARRRRTDLVASAIRGRPWLARAASRLSMIARRIGAPPGVGLSIAFPDSELDTLVAATLGPVEEHDVGEIIQPRWGQIVPVVAQVGDRVTLRSPGHEGAIAVRYVCNGQEGALQSRTWRLEQGDSPVLLVALVGASLDEPIDEAMKRSGGVAGVLLLEEGDDGSG